MPLLPLALLHLNPWKRYEDFRHHTPAQRHEYVIGRLENARRREWIWIVIVAGIGFFTDAYSIFSSNMVVPMLTVVYWNHSIEDEAKSVVPHHYELALSIVTLGGALIGQIAFGVAADIWGRAKMYGMELVIIIFATLGVALASSGAESSMSLISLLLCWRFFLGFGLGGDYPLSAVICSEFAPTHLRGRMLATVFFCQSLGQLAAQLVALIVVTGFQNSLPTDTSIATCSGSCIHTVDSMWRLLVGLGAVPAFIALWFRLTIIESPRYTSEVTQNSLQAATDVSHFYLTKNGSDSSTSIPLDSLHRENSQSSQSQVDGNLPAPPQPQFEELRNPSAITFWQDFKRFIKHPGNFKKLAATSLCWFCLDLPFYGLGLMSPRIIRTIWYGSNPPLTSLYQLFFQTAYQSIIVVSCGAIVGNLLAIYSIDKLGRRSMQLIGFFWLFCINIIIGASFQHLVTHNGSPAVVVLYIICQVFFNFGPNTTTYILPAEIFPTRFRCTCHGISAAFGKLGSVIAQCFMAYVNFGHGANSTNVPDWLGYALLCLSFFMGMGLLITFLAIPDVREEGEVQTLEQLTDGMVPLFDVSEVTEGEMDDTGP